MLARCKLRSGAAICRRRAPRWRNSWPWPSARWPSFPGRRLEQWGPSLHAAIEYRDQAAFDHLFGALRAAGLQ